MTKTIRIALYVITLLVVYFFTATILKSCKSKNAVDKKELVDEDITSTEEDDFFENYEEPDEDKTPDEMSEEPDEIDYDVLDKKLKGEAVEENRKKTNQDKQPVIQKKNNNVEIHFRPQPGRNHFL